MAEMKRLLPDEITYTDIEEVNKTLSTLDIKGKDYVEVNERITAFRKLYPTGSIQTEMISNFDGVCVFKAIVGYYNDDATILKVLGTGTAYEKENSSFINKTSYIENCETSAVGRALGMAGFGINKSIASAEEVLNAINNQNITKEEAEEYVLDFGKHAGKKLSELPNNYLHWLYENNSNCKQMIDLLGLVKSDEEIEQNMLIIQDIMKLIDETGVDLDKIKNKYEIDSLNVASTTILNEIKDTLNKHKNIVERVK